MAGEAPAHFIGRRAGGVPNFRDAAVTLHAVKSGVQMHFMGEVDEVRQALQAHPFNRSTLLPVGQQLLRFGRLSSQRAMAAHAK